MQAGVPGPDDQHVDQDLKPDAVGENAAIVSRRAVRFVRGQFRCQTVDTAAGLFCPRED